MKFVIYTGNCVENAKNCLYQTRREITSGAELAEAVKFDHVCAEYANNYGAVAQQMGLKLETVKSYCRRHGLGRNGEALTETYDTNAKYIPCENCGTEIKQIPKRKRKMFCCDACHYQWWNRHLNQVNRKAYYEIACQHCGKITMICGANVENIVATSAILWIDLESKRFFICGFNFFFHRW